MRPLPVRSIDPRFRPMLLKFAYAENPAAAIPPKRAEDKKRPRLAREFMATQTAHWAAQPGLASLTAREEGDFLSRPTECLSGLLNAEELVQVAIQLIMNPVLPPFSAGSRADDEVKWDALDRFFVRLQVNDEAHLSSRDNAGSCLESAKIRTQGDACPGFNSLGQVERALHSWDRRNRCRHCQPRGSSPVRWCTNRSGS